MLSKERKRASSHSLACSAADLLGGSPFCKSGGPLSCSAPGFEQRVCVCVGGGGRLVGTGPASFKSGRSDSAMSTKPNGLHLLKSKLLGRWRTGWGEGCLRHSELAGPSGVFMKMETHTQHSAPLSPSVLKNRNCQDSACLNISLFSHLNLERSSFTFFNLYGVALCFQKL